MPNHIHVVWNTAEELEPAEVQHQFMRYAAQSILENMKRSRDPLLETIRVN